MREEKLGKKWKETIMCLFFKTFLPVIVSIAHENKRTHMST